MKKPKSILDDKVIPWWQPKYSNLLMSTAQLFEMGLYGMCDESRQLKLWIHGRVRTRN